MIIEDNEKQTMVSLVTFLSLFFFFLKKIPLQSLRVAKPLVRFDDSRGNFLVIHWEQILLLFPNYKKVLQKKNYYYYKKSKI